MTKKELQEAVRFIGTVKGAINRLNFYRKQYSAYGLCPIEEELADAVNTFFKVINKTK